MAFEDSLYGLAERIEGYVNTIDTEEATKTAIVLPFISQVLGYDVFDPTEVIPEYTCDVGMKKGEKVDFAIAKNGEIQILIEMKKVREPLNLQHASQLIRYFSASKARIAVLTNGQNWLFYTDLERANLMDNTPFLQLNMLDIDPYVVPELRKMTKTAFDLESVLAAAEEMKYVGEIKRTLSSMLATPDDDLVRLIVKKVYEGNATQAVRSAFTELTAKAAAQFINDRVNDRLKTALTSGQVHGSTSEPDTTPAEVDEQPIEAVTTTLEEHHGFNIVRAIIASEVPFNRVFLRDAKSYCAIIIDDNNRKTVCRLHFNRTQKYLGLFDADKAETRFPLDRVEDIYQYSDQLRETAARFM